MYDNYGTKQVYLVQPTELAYEIPKANPLDTINEGRFRNYRTCDAKGVYGDGRMLMNRVQAERFAKHNGLSLIDDDTQDMILRNAYPDTI